MASAVYDAVAYAMRYWFLILIALMLLTLIAVSFSEYRRRRSVMDIVDTTVGYLEVLSGDGDTVGTRIGLMADNLIGSGRRSDVIINDPDVERAHARITMDGEEMTITPIGKAEFKINGRLATKAHRIFTGDLLTFGGIMMTVHIIEDEEDGQYDA